MATVIKEDPGNKDEETVMSRITIKNEPETTVEPPDEVSINPGLDDDLISSSYSTTEDAVFKTEHHLIDQTFIKVKDGITVKDECIEHEGYDKLSSNSNNKCSHSAKDSTRCFAYGNMDKATGKISMKTEQFLDEIKTESNNGIADHESQLAITDVRTVSPREDSVGEFKITILSEQVTYNALYDPDQRMLVNPAKDSNLTLVTNEAQTFNSRESVDVHTVNRNQRLVCEVCHKCFTLAGDLTSHARIHTKKKSNVCKACGKYCASKSDLTKTLSDTYW